MNIIYENKIIFNNSKLNREKFTKAIFFDRDGVINEDCHYIKDPSKVKLCVGAKFLIRKIFQENIPIVIITNQSGISKKYLTWNDYKLVTERIINDLGKPNPIAAIYSNSHLDTNEGNNWRKPNPNMLFQAAKDLNLDLERSILIGDRLTDIESGYRAGLKTLIHVMTGHGIKEIDKVAMYFNSKSFKNKDFNKIEMLSIKNLMDFPSRLIN